MTHNSRRNRNLPLSTRSKGFTLIELLVVIAIIALLAAILFPVFGRARENARRSSCQSNLKQVGIGIMQYSQDYDETLPRYGGNSGTVYDWVQQTDHFGDSVPHPLRDIQPYVKSFQVMICPSATTANPNTSNYLHNALIFGGGRCPACDDVNQHSFPAKKLAALPGAATVAMLQEYFQNTVDSYAVPRRDAYNPSTGATTFFGVSDPTWVSHFGGSNLLFCDGHVKWRVQTSITAHDFGLASSSSYDANKGGLTCGTVCQGGFPPDPSLVTGN